MAYGLFGERVPVSQGAGGEGKQLLEHSRHTSWPQAGPGGCASPLESEDQSSVVAEADPTPPSLSLQVLRAQQKGNQARLCSTLLCDSGQVHGFHWARVPIWKGK